MDFHPYRLRPIAADDGPALFDLIVTNRFRLEDFFAGTIALTRTLEDTEKHVKNMLARSEAASYYAFVIVDTRDDSMAGFVDIKNIDHTIPKAELGAFMDARHEGKGIASRALDAITKHCFDVLKLDKLLIRTHERNAAARKVIERNGYQLEGIVRKDYRTTAGDIVDLMYYGRIRE